MNDPDCFHVDQDDHVCLDCGKEMAEHKAAESEYKQEQER